MGPTTKLEVPSPYGVNSTTVGRAAIAPGLVSVVCSCTPSEVVNHWSWLVGSAVYAGGVATSSPISNVPIASSVA